ncbi:hypothetical protein M2G39_19905 [Vibrio vulnificus]|nr:hypothetical protein [Vibrio vulnificus]
MVITMLCGKLVVALAAP